ncbi:MAG: hypothetical protein GY699_22350 [Desulfobacteraceae bacterium]|nr:hypothetical protein [Desulfobacteraceae bacterium]
MIEKFKKEKNTKANPTHTRMSKENISPVEQSDQSTFSKHSFFLVNEI